MSPVGKDYIQISASCQVRIAIRGDINAALLGRMDVLEHALQ